MHERDLHDGRADGLTPLESLDLAAVGSFASLVRTMAKTAFAGRNLGEALDVLLTMFRDEGCRVVLTLSGAMTVAKQGLIVCELIDRRLVHTIISTGALIAHGLTESIGLAHYRYDPSASDEELFRKGYNRIHDTLEMEANLNDVETLVRAVLTEVRPEDGHWSSARLCRALGERLSGMDEGPGILRSAFEADVPVFIPAFTDSEIGLDVATWALREHFGGREEELPSLDPSRVYATVPPFNPFQDLIDYTRFATAADRLGIFTIGGGVPRNWAQQVGPFVDITNHRVGTDMEPPRFQYGVRICPEPVHWGGLSGCTYSEGVSWGKFVPRSEGGRWAEVLVDATAVWPLLMKAVFEELDRS